MAKSSNGLFYIFSILISAVAFLILVSSIAVCLHRASSTKVASYNSTDNETSADKLINWWVESIRDNNTDSYIFKINKTSDVTLSISPPTCCWPLFYATSKRKCLLLETHIAYCAAQNNKKCAPMSVQRGCAISGLRQPSGYTCDTNRMCCKALTASCLSCSYGVPIKSFCNCKPKTPGC